MRFRCSCAAILRFSPPQRMGAFRQRRKTIGLSGRGRFWGNTVFAQIIKTRPIFARCAILVMAMSVARASLFVRLAHIDISDKKRGSSIPAPPTMRRILASIIEISPVTITGWRFHVRDMARMVMISSCDTASWVGEE